MAEINPNALLVFEKALPLFFLQPSGVSGAPPGLSVRPVIPVEEEEFVVVGVSLAFLVTGVTAGDSAFLVASAEDVVRGSCVLTPDSDPEDEDVAGISAWLAVPVVCIAPDASFRPPVPDDDVVPEASVRPPVPEDGALPDTSTFPVVADDDIVPEASVRPPAPKDGVLPETSTFPVVADDDVVPEASFSPPVPDDGVLPDASTFPVVADDDVVPEVSVRPPVPDDGVLPDASTFPVVAVADDDVVPRASALMVFPEADVLPDVCVRDIPGMGEKSGGSSCTEYSDAGLVLCEPLRCRFLFLDALPDIIMELPTSVFPIPSITGWSTAPVNVFSIPSITDC